MWWDGEHACGEVDNMHVGVGDMHVGGGGEHACGGRGICMSKNLDRPFVRTISALSICYTMSCCASRLFGHAECEPPYTLGDRAKNWNT